MVLDFQREGHPVEMVNTGHLVSPGRRPKIRILTSRQWHQEHVSIMLEHCESYTVTHDILFNTSNIEYNFQELSDNKCGSTVFERLT